MVDTLCFIAVIVLSISSMFRMMVLAAWILYLGLEKALFCTEMLIYRLVGEKRRSM